jgi:hypothetical protein
MANALAAVQDEIARHERGEGSVSDVQQLTKICLCLQEMGRLLAEGGSAEAPRFGLGRMITDSWPLGSAVGDAVLRAEQGYLRAVEQGARNTQ